MIRLLTQWIVRLGSWLSLVLVLSYCQSGSALLAEKGAQLVDQHCSTCHLSVGPALLDRQTWLEQVLPAMAPKLGIGTTANGEYYPETNATLPFEEWLTLVDYFRQFAPDTLLPAQRAPVSSDHSLFTIKPAPADSATALTLMVHLEKDRVYSAQATNAMLVQWDQHFNRVDSVRFPAPVVQLHVRSDSELFATSIGTMRAQDQWAGSLIHQKGSSQTVLAQQMPRPIHTASGDFNRDGRTDWLIAGFGHTQGGLYLTSQRADATYETRLLTAQPGATQIEVGDYNADGWPDAIVLFAHANEGLWLFQNDQKGGFKSIPLLQFLPLAGSSSFQLVDLNKDGKLDLIYTSGDNSDYSRILKPYHGLYIYLNDGNFKFQRHWFYPINGATKVLATDFDLDGDVDLATIAFFADFQHHPQENFLYFKQTQPLHFEPYSLPVTAYGRWICMDAKDWDGDGDTDLVLGNFSKGFRNLPHVQPHWNTKIPFIILENKTRNKLDKQTYLVQ